MKRVISYSFFKADAEVEVRSHYDSEAGSWDRYWYNIPALVLTNSVVYPEFITRFYVQQSVLDSPLGGLFDQLRDCPKVEVITRADPELNKMPMLWRMLPLWDPDVELFIARDVDSIANVKEIIATRAFIDSEFAAHGIRTHPHHKDENCILLGGLCGFKNKQTFELLPVDFTFDDMLELGIAINPEWPWGTDLEVLTRVFLHRNPNFISQILDSPILSPLGYPENHTPHERTTLDDEDYLRVDLSHVDVRLLTLCDELTEWGGQPIDSRSHLEGFFEIESATTSFLKKMLTTNDAFSNFYLNKGAIQDSEPVEHVQTVEEQPVTKIIELSDSQDQAYMSPLDLPVVLMVYNRPEHTRAVLDGLHRIGASNLTIYADGLRQESDRASFAQVRQLISEIHWTRPNIIEREQNLGLADSIRSAADEVFEREEFLILLEDDCVPQQHFLTYMYEVYRRYRNHPRIFGASGHTVQHSDALLEAHPHDIYFTPRIGSWGWGTWKDKWLLHQRDLLPLVQECLDKNIDLTIGGSDIPQAIEGLLQGTLKDVWTLHWLVSVYLNKGYYIYPTRSHIDNIGTDGTGVHCGVTDKFKSPLAQYAPIRFPDDVFVNEMIYQSHRKYFDVYEYSSSQAVGKLPYPELAAY